MYISDSVKYIGVDDTTIDIFESQYPVPQGVSYNSYVILDEKTALMDTVDVRGTVEWSKKLKDALGGRTLDYIVVQHMEPDHAGSLAYAIKEYPEAIIVGNAKTFVYISQFFEGVDISARKLEVKEGDNLSLGSHSLTFVMAPMVHWPEVMVTYEDSEKLLFAADGFGKFGAVGTSTEADTATWTDEARRYFINIVGKYGPSVQGLLKKATSLDIAKILPLHGPIITSNLGFYIDLYDKWSSYTAEESGVLVAYASIHGHTAEAAKYLSEEIKATGNTVEVIDLSRIDVAQAVALTFKYDRLALCAATYDGGAFVPMEDFLHHLQIKACQNKKVALLENGTWGPVAAKAMRGYLETMKNMTILEPVVTIKSAMKESDKENIKALAKLISER